MLEATVLRDEKGRPRASHIVCACNIVGMDVMDGMHVLLEYLSTYLNSRVYVHTYDTS